MPSRWSSCASGPRAREPRGDLLGERLPHAGESLPAQLSDEERPRVAFAARTLAHETPHSLKYVQSLATQSYGIGAQGAAISSGSFVTLGMVIAPCSMRTLAAIAHGLGDNLIHRAADVILKERRKLVLVVRESPFNEIHLENMLKLARMGVVILPPVPAFYNNPQNLDDMINHITMRVIDQFDIHLDVMNRWDGVLLDRKREE